MKRVGILRVGVSFCLALWSFSHAWASEGGHEAGGAALPQLDATLYPGMLFWAALTFFLFFLVMRFFALPAMQDIQGRRKTVIDVDLAAARVANEDAKMIMAANETALEEARVKAQKTVNDIMHAAAAESAEQREKQNRELAHRLQVAQDNLIAEKMTALEEAPRFINDVVQALVAKVVSAPSTVREGK